MSEIPYKIRVKKGDYEVEVQGSEDWVEKKFKELTSKEFQTIVSKTPMSKAIPETLVEFLDKKGNPQKHTELVTVYAYWLFNVEKMTSFNVSDIVACYDKTRRAKPKNLNQIMNNNVRNHFFAVASEKKDGFKAWFITRTGEEAVERMK